jgi:hypothetical protein
MPRGHVRTVETRLGGHTMTEEHRPCRTPGRAGPRALLPSFAPPARGKEEGREIRLPLPDPVRQGQETGTQPLSRAWGARNRGAQRSPSVLRAPGAPRRRSLGPGLGSGPWPCRQPAVPPPPRLALPDRHRRKQEGRPGPSSRDRCARSKESGLPPASGAGAARDRERGTPSARSPRRCRRWSNKARESAGAGRSTRATSHRSLDSKHNPTDL